MGGGGREEVGGGRWQQLEEEKMLEMMCRIQFHFVNNAMCTCVLQ